MELGKLKSVIRKINVNNIQKGFRYIKKNGFKGLSTTIEAHVQNDVDYQEWFLTHRISHQQIIEQRKKVFLYEPRISLIVPAYHTPIAMFNELIMSIKEQTYHNWELCVAMGSREDVELIQRIRELNEEDKRIRYKILAQNEGISGNTNEALSIATGEFIAFIDHDDILEADALYEVVKVLQKGKTDIVYTDEDKVNENLTEFSQPNFKPDFSIELLCSQNYITHLFVVKKEIVNKIGGLRSEFDGAQDYDLILRCIEDTDKIEHVPKILYHWRMIEGSTAENPKSKMYCYEAGKKAIQEHFKRLEIHATVKHAELLGRYHCIYEVENPQPLVSVIIAQLKEKTSIDIEKPICQKGNYRNLEFIYENAENVQKAYNIGVQRAKGKFVLLIHGEMELLSENAIYEMVGICSQKGVGAVGTKILYCNGKIYDAGIILGYRGKIGHAFRGLDKHVHSYMNRAEQNGNYSAISSDVLLTSKSVFDEVGGFSVEKDWEYSQVLFCEKIRKTNRRIVFHGFAEWRMVKSVEPEKKERTSEWNLVGKVDPFYNQNLSLTGKLFTLDK